MKLLISPEHLRPKANVLLESDNHVEQLVGAFCTMDADIVNVMLDGVSSCNNTTREECYDQLVDLFSYCTRKKDTYFKAFPGRCKNSECNASCNRLFTFVADRTGNYINLQFVVEKGRAVQFKECVSIRTPIAKKRGSKLLFLNDWPF